MLAQGREPPRVARVAQLRGGLGAAQALFPVLVSRLLVTQPLDRRSRGVIRVLGIRQLGQALVTGTQPSAAVLLLGAEVDAAHAASMGVLAQCSRCWRRAALADALIASLFALTGVAAAHGVGGSAAPSRWCALWDRWAHRVAARLVPHRLWGVARPNESRGDPHA